MRIMVTYYLLLFMACSALGSYHEHKKKIKCYQCAYSPGRYVTEKVKIPQTVCDGYECKMTYTYKTVQKFRRGGWEPCKKGFSHYEAKYYGIDVWDCYDNCYLRQDKYKNLFRGCYKGEWKIDPYLIGCNQQGVHGDTWCFCKGDKCNNMDAPSKHSGYA